MKMKLLISLILIASTSFIGCGKDSGGGGAPATTSNNNNPLPSDTTLCANARYQSGRWFDYNGVELPQCRNIQNYMNSKYLQSYDNNNCMSRKYNDKPTIHVILHGINMCAAEEYFKEFGNTNIQPQYGHTHYIGYPPPLIILIIIWLTPMALLAMMVQKLVVDTGQNLVVAHIAMAGAATLEMVNGILVILLPSPSALD